MPRKPTEKSIVDDKFFKLSEMGDLLENMERKRNTEMTKRKMILIFLKMWIRMKMRRTVWRPGS